MIKSCHNCGYIRKPSDSNSIDECPKCGAYYKKIVKTSVPENIANASFRESDNKESLGLWANILFEIKEWCVGRFWFVRIPVLLYLSYILIRKLNDWQSFTIFDGIILGIHEMGHPLFSFFGRFMMVAGGTILQCLAPIFAMFVLGKQRDYFGITFCLSWLAINFIGISVYMSDATDLELDLVTIGGSNVPVPKEDMHDWHILFNYMGLLSHDKLIGSMVYWLGILLLTASIVLGSILVYWMLKLKKVKG